MKLDLNPSLIGAQVSDRSIEEILVQPRKLALKSQRNVQIVAVNEWWQVASTNHRLATKLRLVSSLVSLNVLLISVTHSCQYTSVERDSTTTR